MAGLGGLRDYGEHLAFRPQLPPGWRRLCFHVRYRGQRLHVDIGPGSVTYTNDGPDDITVVHAGDGTPETLTLAADDPVDRGWQPVAALTAVPEQPAGRAPHQVGPTGSTH